MGQRREPKSGGRSIDPEKKIEQARSHPAPAAIAYDLPTFNRLFDGLKKLVADPPEWKGTDQRDESPWRIKGGGTNECKAW